MGRNGMDSESQKSFSKRYSEEIERVEHRTIKINEVMPIDDISMGNIATYIEDAKDGSVCVCGKITDIQA